MDVHFVKHPQSTDVYLKVKSPGKVLKETGMKSLFESRFEQELERIKEGLTRKHATKMQGKVHQRIGRYKQKYPSVSLMKEGLLQMLNYTWDYWRIGL